jgi:hypothetical protein
MPDASKLAIDPQAPLPDQWAAFNAWITRVDAAALAPASAPTAAPLRWLATQAKLAAKDSRAEQAGRAAGAAMDEKARQAATLACCAAIAWWKHPSDAYGSANNKTKLKERGLDGRLALQALLEWGWAKESDELGASIGWRHNATTRLDDFAVAEGERAAFALMARKKGSTTLRLMRQALRRCWLEEARELLSRGRQEGVDFTEPNLPADSISAAMVFVAIGTPDWEKKGEDSELMLRELREAGAPLPAGAMWAHAIEAEGGCVPALRAFGRLGLDPNAPNHNGESPLAQCVERGWADGCEALLALGANPFARDASGLSATERAKAHRNATRGRTGSERLWAMFEKADQARQESETLGAALREQREALGAACEKLMRAGLLKGPSGEPLTRESLLAWAGEALASEAKTAPKRRL